MYNNKVALNCQQNLTMKGQALVIEYLNTNFPLSKCTLILCSIRSQ